MKAATGSVGLVSAPDLLVVLVGGLGGLVQGGAGGELDAHPRHLRDDDPHPLDGGRELRRRRQVQLYSRSQFWRRLPHSFGSFWRFSLILSPDVNLWRLVLFLWTLPDCCSMDTALLCSIIVNFGDIGFCFLHRFKVES